MTEQAGDAAAVLDARRTALLARGNRLASADRALSALVQEAYAATLSARRRLDDIEAQVEALVGRQDELALDTPTGLLAAQRFLAAKLREIHDVAAAAAADAAAKKTLLEELRAHYETPSAAGSTG
jgi:Domain of unknown function (DUF4226)